MVEIQLATVGLVARHIELDVFHAALQPVQRITGQGVGTGSGHPAEGSGRHTHGEPAGREALGPPGSRPQLAERGGPVRTPAGGPLLRHRRSRRHLPGGCALLKHGLHGCHELGSLHHFDLGIKRGSRQFAETTRQGQQPPLFGRFDRLGGLVPRRSLDRLVFQGLGEGVRPPVPRNVRDHWRHLLSS